MDNKKQSKKKVSKDGFDRTALEELLKRRFFYAPAFSVYGGVKGLYDYGPPGTAMKNNLLQYWRQHFVLEENMFEIETTCVTPEVVFKASGHVEKFQDLMVRDLVMGDCFRADHLLEQVIEEKLKDENLSEEDRKELILVSKKAGNYLIDELDSALRKYGAKFPETGNDISSPFPFNLMFCTQIGPTGKETGYLRPETAQGIFLNFRRLLEQNGNRLPFASAQVGMAFRNEISPRSGLLRIREFTLAEIEHFVLPGEKDHIKFNSVKDQVLTLLPRSQQLNVEQGTVKMTIGDAVSQGIVDNETLGYFLARCHSFLLKVGINPQKVRFRQHLSNEMAHYACDCWDAEIETSYGWIECVGNADRSAYDLSVHSQKSGETLSAFVEFKDGPKVIDTLEMCAEKSEIGKEFRADGGKIIKYIESIRDSIEIIEKIKDQIDSTGEWNFEDRLSIPARMIKFKKIKKKITGQQVIPGVIEPSFGIGRILYCLFEHAYYTRPEDSKRAVLAFKPIVAPFKVSIMSLMQKPELIEVVPQITKLLTNRAISHKVDDSGATIGRRYCRNDEIGVPFAITIDYTTLVDNTITLRERDTTKQVRVPITEVADVLFSLIYDIASWDEILVRYPQAKTQDE